MIYFQNLIVPRGSVENSEANPHRQTAARRGTSPRRAVRKPWLLFTLWFCVCPAFSFAEANPVRKTAEIQSIPLEQFLWREVKSTDNQSVGTVRDVLCDVPSGRIVYVLVDPSNLYDRPKAVAPESLSVPLDPAEPVQLKMTLNEWLNSGRLDWSGLEITQRTDSGESITGVYKREWVEQQAVAAGKNKSTAPASAAISSPSSREFVSLGRLNLKRVKVPGWDQDGFLNEFLIDWTAKRVTHALVSPEFAPISPLSKPWYAIPIALLMPPDPQGTLGVKSTEDAIVHAKPIAGDRLRTDIQEVYQFSPKLLASYANAAE